jgi:hypothetical protein
MSDMAISRQLGDSIVLILIEAISPYPFSQSISGNGGGGSSVELPAWKLRNINSFLNPSGLGVAE